MSRSLKVLALVSIMMAALLFAANRHGRSVRARQSLEGLPSTARALLRIDVRALERTAGARILLRAFVPDDALSEIETICGFDPLASLSDATLWVRGPDEEPFQAIGLMLRGRSADGEALAACHRLLVERRGGSVLRLDGPSGPLISSRDGRSAISLLDERTIVTGSVRTVTEMMEVRRGTAPSLLERPTMARLWPTLSAGAAIAAIVEPPEHWKSPLAEAARFGGNASPLDGAQAIALSLKSGNDDALELYIEVSDEVQAEHNAELIEAWIATPPDAFEPPWLALLQSARVRRRAGTIMVELDVTPLSSFR
jgi:hypothetical protein